MRRRLHIGSDHAAVELRDALVSYVQQRVDVVVGEVVGPIRADARVDYPDIAVSVGRLVQAEPEAFGLLVCGTGQGMAITANRIQGIRAVVCSDTFSASMGRAHNDANVLCMGARVLGLGLATAVLDAFVSGEFGGGRHRARVEKIMAIR